MTCRYHELNCPPILNWNKEQKYNTVKAIKQQHRVSVSPLLIGKRWQADLVMAFALLKCYWVNLWFKLKKKNRGKQIRSFKCFNRCKRLGCWQYGGHVRTWFQLVSIGCQDVIFCFRNELLGFYLIQQFAVPIKCFLVTIESLVENFERNMLC